MKARLTKNLGLKLLSAVLAFAVWLVVVNISNPEVTRTKTVTVEIQNEDVILDAAKTYDIIGGTTVAVSYQVRARDEAKIKATDFKAYVDMSNLYDVTGSVPVTIEVVGSKDLIIGTPVAKPSVVHVNTEDIQKKEFDLTTNASGTPADEFSVGDITLDPSKVYVSGPVSLIGQISSVGVEIPVDGATEDVSGTTNPVFYDANGNRINIDDDRITINPSEVSYTASMLRGKSLTLNFNVSGNVADGYRYTGVECATKAIAVRGLKSTLAGLSTLDIPAEALSLEGATEDKQVTIDTSRYLPEGVTPTANTIITVTLRVEALNQKSFTLTLDDIEQIGHTYGYSYRIDPEKITVVVAGLAEDLNKLSAKDLGAKIDYTHISRGTHSGTLTFNPPTGFTIDSYTPFDLDVYDANTESESQNDESSTGETDTTTEALETTSSVTGVEPPIATTAPETTAPETTAQ